MVRLHITKYNRISNVIWSQDCSIILMLTAVVVCFILHAFILCFLSLVIHFRDS